MLGSSFSIRKLLIQFFSSLFRSVALLINVVDILLFSTTLLAPILSPELFALPAYLGLVFPLFLLAHCIVSLYSLFRKHWVRTFFNILLIVLAYPAISLYHPWQSRPLPESVSSDTTQLSLRLLTLNAHAFLYQKFTSDGWHPSLEYIASSDADIVCLQEAVLSDSNSPYVSLESLKKKLPQYPYIDANLAQEGKGSRLILLSKYPITMSKRVALESEQYGAMMYHLDIDRDQPLVLYNLHLESFRLTRIDTDKYVKLAKKGASKELSEKVYTKFNPSYQRRAMQAEMLHQDIKKQHSPYIIVCGDFNDTPISYAHGKLSDGMTDAFQNSGQGFGFTFHVKKIGIRIDHILHSKAIQSYDCQVPQDLGISDHNPITCQLVL